ncbi:hypothetical protein STEG23_036913 [Scotinomys teguina]
MACWVSTLESRPMLTLEINSRPFQGLLDTEVYIIHYMDDILLAAEHEREALKAFASLQDALSRASLQIAPEKQEPLQQTATGGHQLQRGPWYVGKSSPLAYGKAQIPSWCGPEELFVFFPRMEKFLSGSLSAVFALWMLLGHFQMETLVGNPQLLPSSSYVATWPIACGSTLFHYMVSSSMAGWLLSSSRTGVFSSCCLALDSSSSFPCPAFRAIAKSDQDCSLKIREPDVLAPWFLDPGGWSKTAAVSLYFIFPGICTLSL